MEYVESELLVLACIALEKKSEHPLAKAIVAYRAEEEQSDKNRLQKYLNFRQFREMVCQVKVGGAEVLGGNLKFISDSTAEVSEEMKRQAEKLVRTGKNTAISCNRTEHLLGIIAVADVIKEDSPQSGKRASEHGNSRCYADR